MRQMALGLFPTTRDADLTRLSASHKLRKRTLVLLVVINLLSVSLYLCFASLIWAAPGDRGLYGGPGDPIIWAFFAFPWLMVSVLVNIAAIPRIVSDLVYHRDFRRLFISLTCLFILICAFEYDRSRQYNGSLLSQRSPAPEQPSHRP